MLVEIATIGKMSYPKLLSGKVFLGNLPGKPQLCRSSREKKRPRMRRAAFNVANGASFDHKRKGVRTIPWTSLSG